MALGPFVPGTANPTQNKLYVQRVQKAQLRAILVFYRQSLRDVSEKINNNFGVEKGQINSLASQVFSGGLIQI